MVDDLLQHTAQISHICKTMLHHLVSLTDDLTNAINKIGMCAERFSSLIEELRGILESADPKIHSMSSDLRSPVVCMIGYPELMLQGAFGSLTTFQTEQVTQIRQHTRELRAILEMLMNNAKS